MLEDVGHIESRSQWRHVADALAKRKLREEADTQACKPPRKQRKVCTFVRALQLDNLLQYHAGQTLVDYQPRPDEKEIYPDPYSWKPLQSAWIRGLTCFAKTISLHIRSS